MLIYITRMVAMALVVSIIDLIVNKVYKGEVGSLLFKIVLSLVPIVIGVSSAGSIVQAKDLKETIEITEGETKLLGDIEIELTEDGNVGLEIEDKLYILPKTKHRELEDLLGQAFSSGMIEAPKDSVELIKGDKKGTRLEIVEIEIGAYKTRLYRIYFKE